MVKKGIGGANTKTGLAFEGEKELCSFLKKYHNLNWNLFLSKKLLPDDSIFVYKNNTFFIIEIKTQNVAGSVDEKLQTCDFKKNNGKNFYQY